MIAADTSAWLDFSRGISSHSSLELEKSLEQEILVMPRIVLFEILSSPTITKEVEDLIQKVPRLDIHDAYWERAAHMRRSVLNKGFKARSIDCLIAQSCIDEDIPLIASDQDFRHFVRFGLKLI